MSYDDFSWDYYSADRPRKVQNGIKARSERGGIGESWWSRRWLRALEALGMGTRLARGRVYAREGQVLAIEVHEGRVNGRVQGSLRQPYEVEIFLEVFSPQEWEQALEAMSQRAVFAAKLLAGEMPEDIEEAFQDAHLSLFPRTGQDLRTKCNCPDYANPCKHTAAVYYILAERFDEDPFLLFTLRGRSQEALLAALKQRRLATLPQAPQEAQKQAVPANKETAEAPLRLEDQLETFWQSAEALDSFTISPHNPGVDKAVLKRLGPAPYSIGKQNLATLLATIYDSVERAALRKADGGDVSDG